MNQMFKKASSVFTAIVCAASITFSGASLVLADGEIDEQTKTTIETTAEGLTNTIIPQKMRLQHIWNPEMLSLKMP